MKYEFALDSMKGVQNGALLYENGGKIEKIDIKESADIWWVIHNKSSLWEIFYSAQESREEKDYGTVSCKK